MVRLITGALCAFFVSAVSAAGLDEEIFGGVTTQTTALLNGKPVVCWGVADRTKSRLPNIIAQMQCMYLEGGAEPMDCGTVAFTIVPHPGPNMIHVHECGGLGLQKQKYQGKGRFIRVADNKPAYIAAEFTACDGAATLYEWVKVHVVGDLSVWYVDGQGRQSGIRYFASMADWEAAADDHRKAIKEQYKDFMSRHNLVEGC